MNLFILDEDPEKAAIAHCDKHVVKMIIEVCQMLCTNVRLLTGITEGIPYKPTHANHPCTVWIRASRANFAWSLSHARALSAEYTSRYGKRHKCLDVINWASDIFTRMTFPAENLTKFAVCVSPAMSCRSNPAWKDDGDPVILYRLLYIHDKAYFAKWKNGKVPSWFVVKPPPITCPYCGIKSYSPGDIEHHYCGSCHKFH